MSQTYVRWQGDKANRCRVGPADTDCRYDTGPCFLFCLLPTAYVIISSGPEDSHLSDLTKHCDYCSSCSSCSGSGWRTCVVCQCTYKFPPYMTLSLFFYAFMSLASVDLSSCAPCLHVIHCLTFRGSLVQICTVHCFFV